MSRPPKVNSESQRQLDSAQEKFTEFNEQLANFNPLDSNAPVQETEPQTKMSNREIKKSTSVYVKPIRSINRVNSNDRKSYFDEKHRSLHERDWEYVQCIVENNEVIGEDVEVWTAKWGCDPAHFWRVPVNKSVMIPRLLANQLAKCRYHRLRMEEKPVATNEFGTMTGSVYADHVINRISARTVGDSF